MKKKLILISFIGVIAAGIYALQMGQGPEVSVVDHSSSTPFGESRDTAQSPSVPEAQPPVVTDTISLPEKNEDTIPVVEPVVVDVPTPKPTPAPTPTPTPAPVPTQASVASNNTYKNGTYTQTVSYRVPEGANESITVSLTIKDDVVTALTYSADAKKRESAKYQDRFGGLVENLVVGESLDSISLSRVGGASLTTRAFNTLVDQIQYEAQV